MDHQVFGKKLSRTRAQRRLLLMNLARSLIIHGSIQTTGAKAKALVPLIDKLITRAKRNTVAGQRRVRQILADRTAVNLLLADAKTRFNQRNSGYTRIINLGMRKSDASKIVLMQFIDDKVETDKLPTADKTAVKSKPKPAIKVSQVSTKLQNRPASRRPRRKITVKKT
ncbi:50S ribosomal protein L17 [Candidatus Gottesmanbacteria bacterium RBG_16_43_7]|uniref:50S ribosomal protein L17 n=1 Tax=Candidatus Gottesmanbacteria bacterium RBG_16_43_7 TaxID=1798373 RepID=A0A1F5ZA41_9BACT|nr:MAG: 50S ribosomal protein L17 [Candidatus Gottesmanbacteria bacterium RBG_16_43_7]